MIRAEIGNFFWTWQEIDVESENLIAETKLQRFRNWENMTSVEWSVCKFNCQILIEVDQLPKIRIWSSFSKGETNGMGGERKREGRQGWCWLVGGGGVGGWTLEMEEE